ncbi:MAG TPA: DUF2508 family protein [Eubacteriaceae bacterium]|nr:DUF2508 family protein [Eubacteriaceae bacterium]
MSSLEKYKETSTLEIIKNQWKEFIKLFLKKEQIDIEEQQREEERKEFLELVYKAKEDWKESQNYFENVSHPDLVDLAIHRMEAAKIFYMYLLKEAKRKGISL